MIPDDPVKFSPNLLIPRQRGDIDERRGDSILPWLIARHIEKINRHELQNWSFYGDVDIKRTSLGGAYLFRTSE